MINPAEFKDIKRKIFETLGKADRDQILPDTVCVGSNGGHDIIISFGFEEGVLQAGVPADSFKAMGMQVVEAMVGHMLTGYNIRSTHEEFGDMKNA